MCMQFDNDSYIYLSDMDDNPFDVSASDASSVCRSLTGNIRLKSI